MALTYSTPILFTGDSTLRFDILLSSTGETFVVFVNVCGSGSPSFAGLDMFYLYVQICQGWQTTRSKQKPITRNSIEVVWSFFCLFWEKVAGLGDCMVNAANTGGITGFGLDELVNSKAGNSMKEARRRFRNRIPTGTAQSAPSFNHTNVQWVIHVTGPVFRGSALSNETLEEKCQPLQSTYTSALVKADTLGCKYIAFCLLSCGVFRGSKPLQNLFKMALEVVVQKVEEGDFFLNAPLKRWSL
ncbi:MAG: hypothetical protein SGBAC_002914 [Bacillariaceae sp.]